MAALERPRPCPLAPCPPAPRALEGQFPRAPAPPPPSHCPVPFVWSGQCLHRQRGGWASGSVGGERVPGGRDNWAHSPHPRAPKSQGPECGRGVKGHVSLQRPGLGTRARQPAPRVLGDIAHKHRDGASAYGWVSGCEPGSVLLPVSLRGHGGHAAACVRVSTSCSCLGMGRLEPPALPGPPGCPQGLSGWGLAPGSGVPIRHFALLGPAPLCTGHPRPGSREGP